MLVLVVAQPSGSEGATAFNRVQATTTALAVDAAQLPVNAYLQGAPKVRVNHTPGVLIISSTFCTSYRDC